MSTVNILRSLNEGFKIEVRGKTELKVASSTFVFMPSLNDKDRYLH